MSFKTAEHQYSVVLEIDDKEFEMCVGTDENLAAMQAILDLIDSAAQNTALLDLAHFVRNLRREIIAAVDNPAFSDYIEQLKASYRLDVNLAMYVIDKEAQALNKLADEVSSDAQAQELISLKNELIKAKGAKPKLKRGQHSHIDQLMNHIYENLPATVEVAGSFYQINTDFRLGVKVASLTEAAHTDEVCAEVIELILYEFYGHGSDDEKELQRRIPARIDEAIEAAFLFWNRNALEQNNYSPKAIRRHDSDVFSYDYDTDALIADFYREYHIDLTDDSLKLHWWTFISLLNGLSDKSLIKTIGGYRAYIPDAKDTKEEKAERMKLKRAYQLPPKTQEEARRRQEF